MKTYLLIQPHSDDILFSCSSYIFERKNCHVLTVENDPKRSKEDANLFEFLETPYSHLNVDFKDESYYGYFQEHKSVDDITAHKFLNDYFGEEKIHEIETSIKHFLKKFLTKHPQTQVIIPLGIGHPFHLFVRDVVEKNWSNKQSIRYYREFPHSYKRRNQKQLEEATKKYVLIETKDSEEFHDIKWDLAKKFYKTQSGLLFFEQGYIKKRLPEEIYKQRK